MVKLKVGQPGPPSITYTLERTPWVRPSDWLPMPTVLETDEKFVMLVAIYPEYETLSFFRFQGAYTVDWGDGIVEDFVSNEFAYHTYNYSDPGLASANITSEGYKQVLITVTPQAGQNLTYVSFHQTHPDAGSRAHPNYVQEMVISMPNCNGGSWFIGGSNNWFMDCKKVTIVKTGPITTAYNTFSTFYELEEVDLSGFDTSQNENFNGMFASCYKIQEIPYFDTSSGLYFGSIFNSCRGLLSAPQLDTSNAIQMYYYYSDCRSLKEAHINIPNTVTRCERVFQNCYRLEKITGTIDTSGSTHPSVGLVAFFQSCFRLKEIPFHFDCTGVTNLSAFASGCYRIEKPPTFSNTSNVTNTSSMFNSCFELKYAPELDTSNVLYTNDMFSGCYVLRSVPAYNYSKVINAQRMFSACFEIDSFPDMDFSSATNLQQTFYSCRGLIDAPKITTTSVLENASYLFSYCYGLRTLPPAEYLDLSGATTLYQAVYTCNAVEELPNYNTSSCTNFAYAFGGLISLKQIPHFDTSQGTNFSHFLYADYLLEEIPLFDVSNGTDFTNAFRSMLRLQKMPALDFSNATNCTELFRDNQVCRKVEATGIGQTFSVYNNRMSTAELENLFTSLPTVSGKSVNIGANAGTATCDRTIATAKGWTVSG
jgi:hypothetical protein